MGMRKEAVQQGRTPSTSQSSSKPFRLTDSGLGGKLNEPSNEQGELRKPKQLNIKQQSVFAPWNGQQSVDEFARMFLQNIHEITSRIPFFNLLSLNDQLGLLDSYWHELFAVCLVESRVGLHNMQSDQVKCRPFDITHVQPDENANKDNNQNEQEIEHNNNNDNEDEEEKIDLLTITTSEERAEFLKHVCFQIEKMRSLRLESQEFDYLKGLIMFNSGNLIYYNQIWPFKFHRH